MSGLRQQILVNLRTWGNNCGCHQLPERSFFIKGKQFPVCARCTGVLVGQMIGGIACLCGFMIRTQISAAFILTMGFDWLIQAVHVKESNNIRRFITGVMGGAGAVCLYAAAIKYVHRCLRGRTSEGLAGLAVLNKRFRSGNTV